jgi:hypothetical protein
VNLHVLHDARALAALTGRTPLPCDGIVSRLGQADSIAAAWIDGNPLDAAFLAEIDQVAPRLLMYSGTLAAELFAEDPRTWLRPGRAALDEFARRTAPPLRSARRTICFRPHARHVLSDPQSALQFLRDHADAPFEVALAPADMLTAAMLPTAEDHLRRMFESLGPRAAVVILHDARPRDDGRCEAAPLGEGVLPRDLTLELLRRHVPAETPVVLRPQNLDRQLAWLGRAADSPGISTRD